MYYYEKENIVLGIVFNPQKSEAVRKRLILFDETSGEELSVHPLDSVSYVFVEVAETVLLIDGHGEWLHVKLFDANLPSTTITRAEAKKAFYELSEQVADVPEMIVDEINAEISAVRAERK